MASNSSWSRLVVPICLRNLSRCACVEHKPLIATLLAQESLDIPGAALGDPTVKTTRGRVLVMGGDEVYPVATRCIGKTKIHFTSRSGQVGETCAFSSY